MEKDFLKFLMSYQQKKEKALEKALNFLKDKIIDICNKHNLVFSSGMESYSLIYTINGDSEHYYYSDFENKNVSIIESNYEFDLKNSDHKEDIAYFTMKLDAIKKIKSFHNEVIKLESMAREIEKTFNLSYNAILLVSI